MSRTGSWRLAGRLLCGVLLAATAGLSAGFDQTAPLSEPEAPAEPLTRQDAVLWGLQRNPELATLRQQHGIAAAAIVIANTYPHNFTWESRVRQANGPVSAGITNRVPVEQNFTIPVEIRGQRTFRRQDAAAALSRTDWEIADQELALAVRVIRAFDTVLFHRDRARVLEEMLRINTQGAERVREIVEAGRLVGADLLVARTEAEDSRAALAGERIVVTTSEADLRRALGSVVPQVDIEGVLDAQVPSGEASELIDIALKRRPDLFARQAAVREAEARLRLAYAERYDNPTLGPSYDYDPTRINMIGVMFTMPLPVFNTRRGEILQREAERSQAVLRVRQTETTIRQDVQAAVARLELARRSVETYSRDVLPRVEGAHREMLNLLGHAAGGADLLRVVEIRRRMLTAREGYLAALWELSQARADLAAAVGDPEVALVPDPTLPPPAKVPTSR